MRFSDKSDLDEILRICVLYRSISLIASTLVFLILNSGNMTVVKIIVAVGMIAANIIGTYLYRNVFSYDANAWVIVVIVVELTACGLLIVMSGGFFSPYLWYFVGLWMVTMAIKQIYKRYGFIVWLALVWSLGCIFVGWYFYQPESTQILSYINIVIAFLIFFVGFYILFLYVGKLNRSRQKLLQINESLQLETKRSEQTLGHIMEIYDTFHLFGITDRSVIMDEMTDLLFRAIAPHGCLLVKTNPAQQIELASSCGISPEHKRILLTHILKLDTAPDLCAPLDISGVPYTLSRISDHSGVIGILAMAHMDEDEEFTDSAQKQFYLHLILIILQKMELQATVEAFIVSAEQNRIAAEIHDTVLQKLFAVACNLKALEEADETFSVHESRDQLRYTVKVLESIMTELREAIYNKLWENDEYGSFADKLTLYINEMAELSEININVSINDDVPNMTINQKTAMYRIICEAVNNSVKHGSPAEINVRVISTDEEWIAEVRDNGKGYGKQHVHAGEGLKNMHRIAVSLRGNLTIDSQEGKGTTVTCRLSK